MATGFVRFEHWLSLLYWKQRVIFPLFFISTSLPLFFFYSFFCGSSLWFIRPSFTYLLIFLMHFFFLFFLISPLLSFHLSILFLLFFFLFFFSSFYLLFFFHPLIHSFILSHFLFLPFFLFTVLLLSRHSSFKIFLNNPNARIVYRCILYVKLKKMLARENLF